MGVPVDSQRLRLLGLLLHLLLPREQEEYWYEASWVPRVEFYGSWASEVEFLKKEEESFQLIRIKGHRCLSSR